MISYVIIPGISQSNGPKIREFEKGKTMAVMGYRTQDGFADYGFSLEFQPDTGWRIYIIFQPSCDGDTDNLQLPYQSFDRSGRCYVNWSSRLDSLGEAKTVAALWAELAQRYQCAQERRRDNTKVARNPESLKRVRADAA
jgi:hypothetical protein